MICDEKEAFISHIYMLHILPIKSCENPTCVTLWNVINFALINHDDNFFVVCSISRLHFDG